MSKRVDIAGASGQSYSFLPLDGQASLTPIGVTYVVAEKLGQKWRVLQVGETNNLAQRDWEPRLEAVRREYPSAELLIRLNVSRRIREAEAGDIAAALSRSSL